MSQPRRLRTTQALGGKRFQFVGEVARQRIEGEKPRVPTERAGAAPAWAPPFGAILKGRRNERVQSSTAQKLGKHRGHHWEGPPNAKRHRCDGIDCLRERFTQSTNRWRGPESILRPAAWTLQRLFPTLSGRVRQQVCQSPLQPADADRTPRHAAAWTRGGRSLRQHSLVGAPAARAQSLMVPHRPWNTLFSYGERH